MRFLEVLSIFFLLVLLIGTGYIFWSFYPSEERVFEEFVIENSDDLDIGSGNLQFYHNLRYTSRNIIYYIEPECTKGKTQKAKMAFEILEEKTILDFTESSDKNSAEILILCSNIEPKLENKGHFIAGEGGPTKIVNASRFNVAFQGEVSLFREETCNTPQVALHEVLHALGFDHNNNSGSIMFPVTNCEQTLDDEIIFEIDRVYSFNSLPDLLIDDVEASKVGRYLNFNIEVANYGLRDSRNSSLVLIVDGKELDDSFDFEELKIGSKKILKVENVLVPRSFDSLEFLVKSGDEELSLVNNRAEVRL
jgi:hypothetical protein